MAPEEPVLARFSSKTSHGGFFEEDGEIWAPDGTLLAQSRQLALLVPGG
jgi:acyl-CoA thioesterase